jgi:hypothetical protein
MRGDTDATPKWSDISTTSMSLTTSVEGHPLLLSRSSSTTMHHRQPTAELHGYRASTPYVVVAKSAKGYLPPGHA